MITASTNFTTALAEYSRNFKASIQVNGTEIDGDIQTVDVYRGTGSESILFGATFVPYFTAKIAKLNTTLYDAEVTLRVGIKLPGGTYDYIILGIYHITDITNEHEVTSIKGIGSGFYKLQGKNIPTTGSNTPRTLLQDIRNVTGATILSAFSIARLDRPVRVAIKSNQEAHSCQEVLGIVAALMGGFVTEDNAGNIVLEEYASGETISFSADRFLNPPVVNKYGYEITGVKCIIHDNEENEYDPASYSEGDVNYTFRDKYMTQDLFTDMADTAIGLRHYPGDLSISLGDPRIDPWDILSVTGIDGVAKVTYPMQIHHHIDGGLSTDIDAEMPSLQTGSVTDAITSLNTNVTTAMSVASEANEILAGMEQAATAANTTLNGIYATAEAASDTLAEMQTAATAAQTTLTGIYQDAQDAKASATAAASAASAAQTSASNALTAAQNAQGSADAALVSLSNVEDVVGVLEWITAHGTMTANGSTALDPSKVYFVRDNNGDYHVGNYYYSIVAEPKAEDRTSYYTLSIDESVQNYIATHVVVDTEGLWLIPNSGGNKVLIATGAGSSYTTAGTYIIGKVNNVDTVFASFRQNGATMQTKDSSGNNVQIAHLGYGEGNAESGTATAPYYTLGERSGAIGNYSVVEGKNITINDGTTSFTYPIVASGYCSHAEGGGTTASGVWSHAEGYGSAAQNYGAHAEGSFTIASGSLSHAEGYATTAGGGWSHAQNHGTIANGADQTALGKYNVADTTSAVIIGNGTSHSRSNALTVDWNGNVNIASGAKYKINGSNLSASDVGALPLSGGTMTGQILTSFKNSVATGSYGSAQNTVDGLVGEVRFSSGCMGSASIGTAYTKGSITIPTGWYNYIYSPHRSGGANGAASGDNCNYGNLLLMGMTVSGAYLIRVSSSSISEVKMLGSDYVRTTFTPTSGSSYSSYGGCYYEKYGRTVHVHVGVSGLTTGTATTVYTLPEGYRPSSPVFAHGTGGSWNNIGYMEISTAGVVTVRSQGTYCGADVTFMT